jgi:succinoglycan biosynthesis protein ExoO
MAIREATGSLIAQLDADDVWEDSAVEDLLELLTTTGADVAFGDAVFFGSTTDAGQRLSDIFPAHQQITYIDVARRRTRVNISALGKKRAFLDAGLYDPQITYGEDLDLWMRMLLQGKRFEFTDKVVLRYRRRLGSLTSQPAIDKLNKALDLYNKHLALGEVPQPYRDVLNEEKRALLNMLHVEQGKLALLDRDYKAASAHFSRLSWSRRPLKVFLASLALSVSPALAGPLVRRGLVTGSDSLVEQSE